MAHTGKEFDLDGYFKDPKKEKRREFLRRYRLWRLGMIDDLYEFNYPYQKSRETDYVELKLIFDQYYSEVVKGYGDQERYEQIQKAYCDAPDKETFINLLQEEKEILRKRKEKNAEEIKARKDAENEKEQKITTDSGTNNSSENETLTVSPETETMIEKLSSGMSFLNNTEESFEKDLQTEATMSKDKIVDQEIVYAKKQSPSNVTTNDIFEHGTVYVQDFQSVKGYIIAFRRSDDLALLRVNGILAQSWLTPARMYELYRNFEEMLIKCRDYSLGYCDYNENEYCSKLDNLLEQIKVKKEFFKKDKKYDEKKNNYSVNITSKPISNSEIEFLLSLITEANTYLFNGYYKNKKNFEAYNRAVREEYQRAREKIEEAESKAKEIYKLMFQGKIKFEDKVYGKKLQKDIYNVWSKSYDLLQRINQMESNIDTAGIFKIEPEKQIQAKYLKIIKEMKSLLDIYINWKSAESGIPVEEKFASLQNMLYVVKKIPGPQRLLLSDYVTPMIDAIGSLSNKLLDIEIERNKILYELTGELNYDLMPGGKDVYQFMSEIWDTKYIENISINTNVSKFFSGKKEKFKKFIDEQLPDPQKEPIKFKEWVRDYKDKIWVLLYGSWDTP